MKKKIEALLRDGTLAGNAEFSPLHKSLQTAQRAVARAKKEKESAKNTYRDALDNGEKDQDRLFELLTAFRQSKHMQRYHRAGLKLAKARLFRWMESWLKTAEVPHEPVKPGKLTLKRKKNAQSKTGKANVRKKSAPAGAPAGAKTAKASKAPASAAKKAQ